MRTADSGTVADGALVMRARSSLEAGGAPVRVFAELAAQTGDWTASVWAVCLALEVPASDVKQRLGHGAGEFPSHFHPGEEVLCGEVLESVGLFDVPRPLGERGTEIQRLLKAAMGASGGLRSGHALGLSRRFGRGELTGAFLLLARTVPRRERGRHAEYWAALCTAGELLLQVGSEEDRDVEQALQECRQRTVEASQGRPSANSAPPSQ